MTTPLLPAFIDIYFSTIKNIDQLIARPLVDYRLSFEQYLIIADIAQNKVTSLTDIVKQRKVTKPAIARQLRVLRDLGYLTQTQANTDKRRNVLTLTPLGRRIEAQASEAVAVEFNRWLTLVGEPELTTLLTHLDKVGSALMTRDPA